MNKEFRRFSSIVVLLLSVITAIAQDDKSEMFNPVNYSVTSQMIAPDARAAGLGDVGAATSSDFTFISMLLLSVSPMLPVLAFLGWS